MPAAKAALLLIVWVFVAAVPALAVSQRWSERDWDECKGDNADRAIAACTRILRNRGEQPPKRALAYLRRGLSLRHNGETVRAIADYTEVIRLAPKYAYAYVLRGNAWRVSGDYDRAIADFTRAIDIDPKTANAYWGRAASWKAKQQPDPAIADYAEAIKLEPKDPDNYSGRAWAWIFKGEVDKALADIAAAIELDPQSAENHRYRGYFLFLKGNFPAAAEAFSRSLQIQNDAYAVAWRFLAREHSALNGADELARDSAKLNTRDWPFPVIEFYLGRRSAEDLRKAAATPDQQCEASFYLGESLLVHDASTAAAEALDKAARTCPKDDIEYFVAVSVLKAIKP